METRAQAIQVNFFTTGHADAKVVDPYFYAVGAFDLERAFLKHKHTHMFEHRQTMREWR